MYFDFSLKINIDILFSPSKRESIPVERIMIAEEMFNNIEKLVIQCMSNIVDILEIIKNLIGDMQTAFNEGILRFVFLFMSRYEMK